MHLEQQRRNQLYLSCVYFFSIKIYVSMVCLYDIHIMRCHRSGCHSEIGTELLQEYVYDIRFCACIGQQKLDDKGLMEWSGARGTYTQDKDLD